jgi:glycosyltransferase involved in cell wall biosynthesis
VLELTVLFGWRQGAVPYWDEGFQTSFAWDTEVLSGYRYRFLTTSAGPGRVDRASAARKLFMQLKREPWDVVWIHGYSTPLSLAALVTCRLLHLPAIVREEAQLLNPRTYWRRAAKAPVLRWLSGWIDACYIGVSNYRFWRRYGLADARLHFTPYSVDNAFFQQRVKVFEGQKAELRAAFGLPTEYPVVLMVSKLQPHKNPGLLLDAFAETQRHVPASLLFAGDGELRGELETAIAQRSIENCKIAGFLNQTQIARAYAASDVLVLPSSYEPWGLVINEAMNFSLPIVASDRVGCAPDLVRAGENGWVVPQGDARSLTEALIQLLTDGQLRAQFGQASRSLVQRYSVERTADGVVKAVMAASGGK